MKKITNQLSSEKIEEIFDACNTFTKEDIKKVISDNKETILNESKKYADYVPTDLKGYGLTKFGKEEIEQIKKLYIQKFEPSNSIGRKYYDLIMSNTDVCSACGVSTPTTLDHFVPKSLYPQLCITPDNLVPVCPECNLKKLEDFSFDYMKLPFHPYFESMDEKWLECTIGFNADSTASFKFYCGNKASKLFDKYVNHLAIYNLNEKFSGRCSDEMTFLKRLDKIQLAKNKNDLFEQVKDRKDIAESIDVNSWRSALYRALEIQFDEYCEYLKNCNV